MYLGSGCSSYWVWGVGGYVIQVITRGGNSWFYMWTHSNLGFRLTFFPWLNWVGFGLSLFFFSFFYRTTYYRWDLIWILGLRPGSELDLIKYRSGPRLESTCMQPNCLGQSFQNGLSPLREKFLFSNWTTYYPSKVCDGTHPNMTLIWLMSFIFYFIFWYYQVSLSKHSYQNLEVGQSYWDLN